MHNDDSCHSVGAAEVSSGSEHTSPRALEPRRTANLFGALRPPAPAIFVILQQYHIVLSPLARMLFALLSSQTT